MTLVYTESNVNHMFCELSNCAIREGVVMRGSHGVCIRLLRVKADLLLGNGMAMSQAIRNICPITR